jgi:hypothetical protein
MFQVSNLSVNARFTYANFTLSPSDPRRATVHEVHGSHLTAAYVVAHPIVNGRHAVVVKAEFDVAHPFIARVQVAAPGANSEAPIVDAWVGAGGMGVWWDLLVWYTGIFQYWEWYWYWSRVAPFSVLVPYWYQHSC